MWRKASYAFYHSNITPRHASARAFAPDILKTIPLTRGDHAGETVRLRRLSVFDIARMAALMKSDTSSNLIPRSAHFLKGLFKRGDTGFGIVTENGKLIGQALMRSSMDLVPEVLHDALKSKFNQISGAHAYIGSIIIDPTYKGNRLMDTLVNACLDEAVLQGNAHAHARVRIENDQCLKKFENDFGFQTVLTAQSPDAEQPRLVHFLHRAL